MRTPIGITLTRGAVAPKYPESYGSGFDFLCLEAFTILGNSTYTVDTGIIFELPEGMEIEVRSGIEAVCRGVTVKQIQHIDRTCTNIVQIKLYNNHEKNVSFSKGSVVARGVVAPVCRAVFLEPGQVDNTTTAQGTTGVCEN